MDWREIVYKKNCQNTPIAIAIAHISLISNAYRRVKVGHLMAIE